MDESKTKSKDNKKHRKLTRTPEVTVCDIPTAVVTVTTQATNVMGGGITTPHSLLSGSTTSQENHHHQQPHYISSGLGGFNKTIASNTERTQFDNQCGINLIDNYTKSDPNKKQTNVLINNSNNNNNNNNNSSSSSSVVTTTATTIKTGSSDSMTFTRIHNFLFKSSDTAKSYQMKPQQKSDPTSDCSYSHQHEQSSQYQRQYHQKSSQQQEQQGYYYTMTSPNNPFLPEIIAKNYTNDHQNDKFVDDVSKTPSVCGSTLTSPLIEKYSIQEQKKVFTLSSPTEIQKHHKPLSPQISGRSLNPFISSPISTSTSQQSDLNAKREEFLKATMKICLVVSPPSKLQLKSKSLTHLDTLDSMIACRQETTPSTPQKQKSEQLDASYQQQQSRQQNPNQSHHHQSSKCNKICCLGSATTSTTAITSPTTSTILNSNVIGCNSPGSGGLTTNQSVLHYQGSMHKKKSSFMQRKKPLLTRSEVSSSEYFSVYFYTESGCQEEEFLPATKGVTLSEALSSALKRRNLTFSQITISDNNFQCFTETGSPPYTTSLDENTDVENLAGKLLIVTEKDGNKKNATLQKAASFGSRTRPPRLLSSASTEETTDTEQKIIPGKQLKQRWSGLFGIKNPQQSQLCELLNNYTKNGVPQKTSSLNFDHPDFDLALNYLDNMHKSWRDFVQCTNMSDNDVKIQSAIWELVTTEVDYIHALQTVTDLFLACLEAIQDERLLTDVDQNKLFSNIRDICEANLKFWTLYIFPMVAHSITTNHPMCIDYFQPGFLTFATTFAPYKKYCAEQSTCQFYCKELNRNNALYTAYLAWCESQKMCNRLRLADILVRPMQRLTKYSLLLTAVRKHITDENDGDIMDSMIHSVENFVCSVNTHLTTRQENERLKGIMARIESYDIVDSNNEHLDKFTKQYCTMLDLCAPMKGCACNQGRHLFMEGDLKFKDSIGKADVHCFLLTDILLICKTIAKKGQGTLKVIRQPYLTDRLVVKHKDNQLYCVYLNEYQMAVTAFTLQCTEAKNWHDAITKAKHIYSRLKQGTNWDGFNFKYTNNPSGNNADTLGIKKSPLNSSIGSRVSSLNNSHSGSVELNDSRNISVDFEKTNSLSSDEGSLMSSNHTNQIKPKTLSTSPHKLKTSSSNQLVVQPLNNLGQSLPNLNLNQCHASNNTLLVPGNSHSGNLLSPSHRGISYPPPSPTRATLRRGFAFSSSIKNPPLVKTRNITSQNSFSWHQTPATPVSPKKPQQSSQFIQQQQTPVSNQQTTNNSGLQISNESDV